jgi:MFS transporter, DHA2 family, multidrug resistance protein
VNDRVRAPLSGAGLVLATGSLSLAMFMQVLDTTIANVSIPAIAGDLAVSPSQGTWVITSFAASNAIALPLAGWLARRFGEVRLFVLATMLFTLASWLCGLAPNFETLLAARILQGASAGPMVPLSQSLLLNNYPEHKRGMALAFWAMTTTVAPVVGPYLGGWITDNLSWPWIFYINVPVGILCSYVTWQMLKRRETATLRLPIDMVGLVLLVIGVGCLQVMLDRGNELDWFGSNYIMSLGVTALFALSVLIVWELTAKHPVIDLSLFLQRNFTVSVLAVSLGYLIFFAGVVLYPLWLQTEMGYTATWAGIASIPLGIMAVILSPIVGRNQHHFDLRLLASFSFVVFAVSCFWQSSYNTYSDIWHLIEPRFLQGMGMAFFFVPLTTLMLIGMPAHRIASAMGLSNFMRVLSGSIGTSLSISLWQDRSAQHYGQLIEHITPYNPASTQYLDSARRLTHSYDGALDLLANTVNTQAVTLATTDIFWLSGWVFLGLIVLVWMAKAAPRRAF